MAVLLWWSRCSGLVIMVSLLWSCCCGLIMMVLLSWSCYDGLVVLVNALHPSQVLSLWLRAGKSMLSVKIFAQTSPPSCIRHYLQIYRVCHNVKLIRLTHLIGLVLD